MTFTKKSLWVACMLSTIFVFGAYVPIQAQITGLPDSMCVSDGLVVMSQSPTGGTYAGPGVSGTTFTPASAGAGTHTITYTPPSYTVSSTSFIASSGAGTTISLADEATSGSLPLGFNFEFFGTNYTGVFASSNGFLTFSSGQGTGCCSGQALPNASAPNNLIAFAWEDLDPGNGLQGGGQNRIWYQTIGSAPNRQFRYNFRLIDHFSDGNNITGMVILYETSNIIDVHLASMPSDGGAHTEGIENASGTIAVPVSGRNAANWSATNSSHRWTPAATVTQTVYVGADPSISLNPTNATCANASDGSIDATVVLGTAGTPTYAWSNSASTEDISGLAVASYTLTVTDVNGCSSNQTAAVANADVTPPTALCNPTTVFLDGSGNATVTASDIDNGSSDACGINSLSLNTTSFNCANLGSNPVTLTVTDSTGLTSTCTDTVHVRDTIPPTAICASVTISLDAAGNGTASADSVGNPSTDNCSINSRTLNTSSFTCANLGNNTVLLTVADPTGNTDTCSATVTVTDPMTACNQPPNAVCQNVTVVADGSCQAIVAGADVNNGSTDPETDPLTFSLNPAGPYTVGTTSVQLLVSDGMNVDSCAATITVQDTTDPVAVCQAVTVTLDGSGNATIQGFDLLLVGGGSSDNCSIDNFALSPDSFNCANIGSNAVTLTVTDPTGNSSTCGTTVTVQDTTAPVAICNDLTLFLDGSGNATTTAADVNNSSTDNCSIVSMSIDSSSFTCSNIGSNSVQLTVTDPGGNTSSCTATITVTDSIAPIAICNNVTVQLNGAGSATITAGMVDSSSTDNCGAPGLSVDSTSFSCSNVGANTVTLTATDASANSSTCTATVTVQDNVNPTAICQDITIQLGGGGTATISAPDIDGGSADACGIASLSASVTSFTCDSVGLNSVTLTVTDANSNTATCNAFVTVQDTVPPNAICSNVTIFLDGSGNATVTANDIDSSSTDACGIASLSVDSTSFTCANTGSNPVVLTVTDANGNSSTCSATVTVSDSTDPTAVCQDLTVHLNAGGTATITAADVNNGSSDNCGTPTVSIDSSSFACSNVGANTVTLTATDASANTSTCTATITVQDSIAPIATCQDVTLTLDGSGNASLSASDINNGSSDACGIASLSASPTSFVCANVGANTSTLTVTDVNGNSATCTSTVTVQDTLPPIASCQNLTVFLDGSGIASITAGDVDSSSSDNCTTPVILSVNDTSFTCSDRGANSVTLTASDANGNSSTCTSTVTVNDSTPPVLICNNFTAILGSGGTTTISITDISSISDNCNIQSNTASQLTFDCSETGANTVTVTGTDSSGNSSMCTATVTVSDTTAPIAVCNDLTLTLDGSGNASFIASDIDNGSSDVCGIASVSATPTSFTCANVGANTSTLTVTDSSGLTSTCTATITIQDTTPPVANCNNLTIFLDGSGNASITAGDVDNSSSDNCGIGSTSIDSTSFTCGNVGANTVTLTVNDVNGNSSTCTSTVTVQDSIAPTANCIDITIQLDPAGNASITLGQIHSGSSDNCSLASTTASQLAFTCSDVGVAMVTVTSTDVNGNVGTCTANVTVQDTSPASFTSCPSNVVTNNIGSLCQSTPVNYTTPNATSACGIDSVVQVSGFPSGTQFPVGITTNTFVAFSPGVNDTCSFTVTVIDTTAPSLTGCLTDTTIFAPAANCQATYAWTDPIASDNCPGVLFNASATSPAVLPVGMTTLTFIASDTSGNADTCDWTVTVLDSISPVWAGCPSNINIFAAADSCGATANWAAPTASDNCVLDIPNMDTTHQPGDFFPIGTTTVTYTAVDTSGNTGICSFTVMVNDTNAPVLTCTPFTTHLDITGNASIVIGDVASFNDSCGIDSATISQTAFTCSDLGANVLTITVTDNNGNVSTCSPTVTVLDTLAPTISCTNITVQLDASGAASIVPTDVATFTDACGVMTATVSPDSFSCADIGGNLVTVTVSDSSGNTSTCFPTVTVQDTVAPVAVCQNITIHLDASGNASITASDVDGGSNDACGIASLSVSDTSFTCTDVGTNTVTLTVNDVNGGSSTCTATVTVEDSIAPIAVCQDITVNLDGSGNGSITANDVDNSSSDACGIASLTVSDTSFACADVGSNTVTLTVTDVNGNASTCTANVTVEDSIAPNAVCQNITVQLDGSGNASIAAADIDGGSNDACGLAPLSATPTSFTCSNVGSNTVTLTVTDVNGNSSTCTSTVTILDTVPPSAVCQDITVFLDATGNTSITASDVDGGSSDACGTPFLSVSDTSFACADVGTNTVTLTVTDLNGNSSTCTANVTVQDSVPPVAICQDITVQLDGSGNASIIPAMVDNGSNDACGLDTLSMVAPSSFTCANVGGNTVTLTVTDVNGNSSTCTANVTIEDTLDPVAVCQDLTVFLDAAGSASITTGMVDNGSSDNCAIDSLSLDNDSFDCSDVGANTVTLTVTDVNGNTSSCTSTITVEDSIAPMLTCNAYTVFLDGSGNGALTVNDVATFSDACGIDSATVSQSVFSCASVAASPISVTVVVADSNGNSSTCVSQVTVSDTIAPSISCPNDTTVGTDDPNCSALVNIPVPVTSDNCSPIIVTNSFNFTGNASGTYNTGTTSVLFTAIDPSGNSDTCSITITVLDDDAPALTCPADTTVYVDSTCNYVLHDLTALATASDNCSGVVLSQVDSIGTVLTVGVDSVTITAVDTAGNSSSCIVIVTVEDTTSPNAVCQNITVQLDGSGNASITANDVDGGSTDNCAIAGLSVDSTSFTCANLGANTVTLTVNDVNGNSSTCTATVMVMDTIAPTITCQNITVQLDASGQASITQSDIVTAFADNCTANIPTLSDTMFTCADTGMVVVTATVTDQSANSSSCTSTVTIEDTVAPIAVCQDLTLFLDGSGNATTSASDVNNGSSDNCGIASIMIDDSTFTCADTGSFSVTLTVTDVSGNASTCTSNITLSDSVAPIAVCQDLTLFLDGSGNASTSASDVNNGSSDNCGIASIMIDDSTFTCADTGSFSVTLTVTDVSGNASTCTSNITLSDSVAPIAVCQDLTLFLDGSGMASTSASDVNNGSSDNCGISTIMLDDSMFTCADTGMFQVTLTVTDVSGNASSCQANITLSDTIDPIAVCQDITVQLDGNGDATITPAMVDNGSSDNCGIDTLTLDDDTFDCADVGTLTVTLTATDVSGNSASCTSTVTVMDTVPAVAVCTDTTIYLDAAGNASIDPTFVDGGSSDNCGIDSMTVSPSTFTCAERGVNVVTLSIVDVNGNFSSCTSNVTVADTILPSIANCPSDQVLNNIPSNCGANAFWVAPTANDNCGSVSIVGNFFPGQFFPVDTTTVIYVATDSSGNMDSCTFEIVVIDAEDPVITNCSNNITVNNTTGQCGANVTWGSILASDNCPGVTLVSNFNSGDFFPVGTSNVLYVATDAVGNTDTCTFDVTVVDAEAPALANCPTNITQANDTGFCSASVTWTAPTATDNCVLDTIIGTDAPGDVFPVGTSTVTYYAIDTAGNVDSCSFDITVNDTEAPVAICPADTTVSNDSMTCGAVVSWTLPGSNDNCGIASETTDFFNGAIFPIGSTTVTMTATDSAGNSDSCTFVITVNDTELPTLSGCPSNITQGNDNGFCSAIVVWTPPIPGDNCPGFSSSSTHMPGDTFAVGNTTVTYTVVDASGNSDSCSFTITVNDTEAPVAVCPAPITVGNDSGQCGANVAFTLSSSDNCGVASTSSSANSGDFFAVGTTTVNYSATDSAGNIDSCSFTITVNDTEAPVAVCPAPITVSNDSGQCGAAVAFTFSNSDNCGVASTSSSANSGDFFAVGTTTVSYTVTDSAGNVDSCSFDITVNDTEAPVATCPAPITVSNDSGQCSAVVTFTFNNSDNCGVASTSSSANSGDTFPVGTTTVSYTVTDSAGNVDSCSFDITVNDTEAPVAICPAPITVGNDSGQCGAAVAFTFSNSDNCGIASTSSSANSGDFFPVGTTTVSYTVTDSAGNVDSCAFDITVNDTEAPVAICPAPITVGNDSGQCGAAVAFTFSNSDNCGVASTSSSANSGDFFAVGTTTVSYTVTDSAGNVDSCSFDITVNDTEAPVAICPAPITVSNDSGQCSAVVTFTLGNSDNCGVASTSSSANSGDTFPVGTTTVSYTVTDSAGNVDSCSFDITVNDTEAPVATCPAPITVSNDSGQCGAAVTFTLSNSDNCGVASAVSTSNSGDFFPVGVTSVTYTVTDSAGNVDSCAFDVTVNDTEAPVAICPAPITVGNDSGQCGAAVTFTLSNSDNCGVASTSSSANSGDFFAVGTTTVSYTVTDSAGNIDSCSFDITVNDTEAPVAICPAPITVGNDSGQCGAAVAFTLSNSDNCGVASSSSSANSGDFFAVGTTTVSYTVTDSAGNVDSCSFDITVNDTEAPVATCPAPITVSNDSGQCSAVVTFTFNNSDNCGVASTSSSANSGDTFPVGTTTVSYTVTDSAGNVDSCSFDITVNDTEAPVAICPAPITVGNDSGQCGAAVAFTFNNSDNCGIASTSSSANSGDFFPVGTTTVSYTVTDSAGNVDSCAFDITVNDTEAPVAICPAPITVGNDSGQCGAAVAFTFSNSDNCGVASTSSSANSGDFFAVGTTTVSYTVTDSAGNVDSCSFDITVNDTEAPVATCPAPITVSNDSGQCSAVVTFTLGNSDNCGVASTSSSANSGDTFPVGTTTVSYTVTDSAGNVDSCSFDITVNDTEAPVAICPAPITVGNDSGQCGAAVTFTLSNSDNCGVASAVSTSNSGDFFPVGVTSITYTVTDSAGNVDSCAFDVTVNDTEAPVAICPAPITVGNDSGQCGAAVTFTFSNSDNCGVASTSSSANSGDFFAVGTTTVSYTVTDSAGNIDSCSFDITVNDTEAPVITCPANVVVANDTNFCSAIVTFSAATAMDNCTGSPTVVQTAGANSGSIFPVGSTDITYEATDSAGNTSSCTFQVIVEDVQAPDLTCPSNIVVANDSGLCGAVVSYTAPVGTDNCNSASTSQTDTTGLTSGDLFPVGTTTLEYTATDTVGNDSVCTFTVTVNDLEAPIIVCPTPVSVSNDTGACSANVSIPVPTAGDNCTPVVVANSFNGSANASGTYPVGVTNVIYTAVDTFGNSDTCSFTVTVTDDELPMITCPGDTTLIADSANCATNYNWPTPATSDNCSVDSVWSSVANGSSFPVGVNGVTYFVTDVNGNLDSCSFNITVNSPALAITLTPSVYNCGHGISCNGEDDGDVTVAWTGGCQPYTVAWNTGDTTMSIDSLSAGTYTVTVTDSLGTMVTDSVVLTEPALLALSTSSDSLVCFGDSTGSIDLTVTGGNDCQPYDYQWSNGDTTEDVSNLAPGTYTVTVTDVSGCNAITIVEIVSLPLPVVELGPDTSICAGLVATLDAGSGFVNYDWSTGDTTQSIIAANPGVYTVTITDIFGCTNSDSVSIGVFQVADTFITPRTDLLICRQDTLILDAGTGFTGFNWSTGDSTQAITVAGFGGPITIVATDSNGCQATDSVFVQFNDVDNPLPVVVPGPDVNLCDGSTVTLDVLDGYFSYDWNTGDTTQSIDVNTAGDYVVTVSNGFGCIGVSDTVSVTTVPNPTPTIFKQNDTMFVNGTYSTYQWNESSVLIPGAILDFYVPQVAGYYSITVSDSNGCVGVSDSLFCDPTVSAEGATEELFGIELYPNPTSGILYVRSLEPINWDVDITVMDMYGHLVKTFHVGQLVDAKQLDLTDIANGMYLLKVEDKKGRASMIRFMIE